MAGLDSMRKVREEGSDEVGRLQPGAESRIAAAEIEARSSTTEAERKESKRRLAWWRIGDFTKYGGAARASGGGSVARALVECFVG